jgi:sulfite exporter TauE/SafE
MLVFGIGAALPLLIVGLLSREALQRWRKQTLSVSRAMKAALGVLLILIGALVLAGFDKHLETVLVNASPQWLTDLTTRF